MYPIQALPIFLLALSRKKNSSRAGFHLATLGAGLHCFYLARFLPSNSRDSIFFCIHLQSSKCVYRRCDGYQSEPPYCRLCVYLLANPPSFLSTLTTHTERTSPNLPSHSFCTSPSTKTYPNSLTRYHSYIKPYHN